MTAQEIGGFTKAYDAGEYPHQRLGQAFLNVHNLTDATLFYMDDYCEAMTYIWTNYLT